MLKSLDFTLKKNENIEEGKEKKAGGREGEEEKREAIEDI